MPTVLHYAFGGGLGHFTRQFAIATELKRLSLNHHSIVVTNSEFAATFEPHFGEVSVICLSSETTVEQASFELAATINKYDPSVLVVDTFPRGIVGELVPFLESNSGMHRLLVARNLPDQYLDTFDLDAFAGKNYEAVFRIENEAPFASHKHSILSPPVVLGNLNAITSIEVAQKRLNINSDSQPIQPLILIVASGNKKECEQFFELANQMVGDPDLCNLTIRFVAPTVDLDKFKPDWRIHHWPALETISAVDLVIGSAGYNLFWETRLTNTPAILFAQERKYDNQRIRSDLDPAIPYAELKQLVFSRLENQLAKSIPFENGSVVIANHLASI